MNPFRQDTKSGFTSRASYLDDDTMSSIQDNIVITVASIVLINPLGQMAIFHRLHEPALGKWIIGGKLNPGETFEACAVRVLKRKLGLEITESRLRFLAFHSWVWRKRQQEPKENGCHNISKTFYLKISWDEEARIRLDPKEHKSVIWEYLESVAKDDDYYRWLRLVAQDTRKALSILGRFLRFLTFDFIRPVS